MSLRGGLSIRVFPPVPSNDHLHRFHLSVTERYVESRKLRVGFGDDTPKDREQGTDTTGGGDGTFGSTN